MAARRSRISRITKRKSTEQNALEAMQRIKAHLNDRKDSEANDSQSEYAVSILFGSTADLLHETLLNANQYDVKDICSESDISSLVSEKDRLPFHSDPLDMDSILATTQNCLDFAPTIPFGHQPNRKTKTTEISFVTQESKTLKESTSINLNDSLLITQIDSSALAEVVSEQLVPTKYQLVSMTNNELEELLSLRLIPFVELPKAPRKIAEASFSEVFLVNGLVYKIAPFNEHYSREAFCREVGIMRLLSDEPSVCKLIDSFILTGKYSQEYILAWEAFQDPENAHPGSFDESTMYGCIVMEDCGTDLESYKFKDSNELVQFIHSLILAIERLEKKYKFEHRDLHWGNVMIQNANAKLIDFSISRMEIKNLEREISKVIYTDLSGLDWLFNGDSRTDPQFGVYKRMRASAINGWKEFIPNTNRCWIKYIIKKLFIKAECILERNESMAAISKLKKISNAFTNTKTTTKMCIWLDKNMKELI